MKFEEIIMPDSVRKEALQILRDLERADDLLEVTRISGIAAGFAMGLGCGWTLWPMDLDALETLFAQAFDRKVAEVSSGLSWECQRGNDANESRSLQIVQSSEIEQQP